VIWKVHALEHHAHAESASSSTPQLDLRADQLRSPSLRSERIGPNQRFPTRLDAARRLNDVHRCPRRLVAVRKPPIGPEPRRNRAVSPALPGGKNMQPNDDVTVVAQQLPPRLVLRHRAMLAQPLAPDRQLCVWPNAAAGRMLPR
jgi:hypothetical protein